MAAVNNHLPPRDHPNTNQSPDVDPVVKAVNQFLPAAKTVDTQSVLKSAEADESFGESDMKEQPCDGTKVLGKRKRVEEEYSAEKEVHEHNHEDCEEKYIAMLEAWAKVHVLSSIGMDIESPDDLENLNCDDLENPNCDDLENPNCEPRLRKPYGEDGDSDEEDHVSYNDLTYNDLKEYYEKREREVLPREMWDPDWRRSKLTNVSS